MLEKKLRQASAQSKKRIFLALAGVALLAVVLIIVVSFADFQSPTPAPEKAVSTEIPRQEKDISALRSRFIDALRTYEEKTEPALNDANLPGWAPDKTSEIALLKDAATSAFVSGDYEAALKTMADATTLAQQILTKRDHIFSSQLSLAEKALAGDNAIAGKLHITRALLVKPRDRQALELARQIDILPQIIALLKKADIARTENNPEKEYAAVSEAFKLDPRRKALQLRATELAQQIREQKFAPLIARALADVEKRRLKAARSSYQQAKALDPNRPELLILDKAINKLANSLDLEKAITQGKAAVARDDWAKALSVYTAAAKKHPDDTTVLDGLQLSTRIVSLQSELAAYNGQPTRLASPNVSAAAQSLLIQAGEFSRNSASLSRQIKQLKNLIAEVNREIPITITSDNQTYILLRGIGKIGITQEKTIQLKPGDYTFEGIRQGYRSKLVKVRIPVGLTSFGVKVICDERI
ncbi:MAG: hypothetical protein ACE5DZ_02510 [Mariprofundus sp.]